MNCWPPRNGCPYYSSSEAGAFGRPVWLRGSIVPSLFVIQGRDQGTRFRLDGSTVTLGRGTSNAVQLHDTEVSREHAEFSRRDDSYYIRDLESSNGTFVNGKPVKEHELASGDQLQ